MENQNTPSVSGILDSYEATILSEARRLGLAIAPEFARYIAFQINQEYKGKRYKGLIPLRVVIGSQLKKIPANFIALGNDLFGHLALQRKYYTRQEIESIISAEQWSFTSERGDELVELMQGLTKDIEGVSAKYHALTEEEKRFLCYVFVACTFLV